MKARPTADSDVRRWDDYHRDPVNDIVIKSSDNVHFRASSYRLSQISPVLAGMFESARPDGEPIELDFISSAIRTLLDLATKRRAPMIPVTPEHVFDFDYLVDFCLCEGLRPFASTVCVRLANQRWRDCLLYASKKGDSSIAKRVLIAQHIRGHPVDSTDLLDLVSRLRPNWQIPILHATVRMMDHGGGVMARWPTPQEIGNLVLDGDPQQTLPGWERRKP